MRSAPQDTRRESDFPIVDRLRIWVCTVPTDAPESDGTLQWDSTTVILLALRAGNREGIGYTYTHAAAASLIQDKLAAYLLGSNPDCIPESWYNMRIAVRNLGQPGLAASAISAVDNALWDLKAKLLDLSVSQLWGSFRASASIYGSGGFTSYSHAQLSEQLSGWVSQGARAVKIKVGRSPEHDPSRVAAARQAIGDTVRLFVDANGAYESKQALELGAVFAEKSNVSWFEEPVTSDALETLRFIRGRLPLGMELSAGEYGYTPAYFRKMLENGAVDVLQADATRCLGCTGFFHAASLCEAFHVPLSAHTAPALHLHLACAAPAVRNIEWFHDHVRIEQMLFDGAPRLVDGAVKPDSSRPGFGLDLKPDMLRRFQSRESVTVEYSA